MKKSIALGFIVAMCLLIDSCKDDETTPSDSNEVGLPLSFSDNPIIFNDSNKIKKVVITPTARGFGVDFSVINKPNWVSLSSESGTISGLYEMLLYADPNLRFPLGVTKDSVEFFTLSGKQQLYVEYWNGSGDKLISQDTVFIDEFSDSAVFSVYNNTQANINATISNSAGISIVSSVSFIAQKNTNLTLSIDRSSITQSTNYFDVTLNYGNGEMKKVVVEVLHFVENKVKIIGDVVDAKYDKVNDLLYFATRSPNEIQAYDASSNQFTKISLPSPPLFLAVSKSGSYAVAAYDGSASLINLSTSTVINTFNTGVQPSDVVLKDSSYAYFFPSNGTHVRVNCVNLQSNYTITPSTGWTISDESRAVLHPSGDYIYVADNGVSPSDVEKLDIRNGVANRLYDSPYHGTYSFGGKLWLSGDGSRIFTRGKTVLNTATVQNLDMIYNGSITLNIPQSIRGNRNLNEFIVEYLDYSSATQKMAVVAKDSYNSFNDKEVDQIYIHNGSNLQYEKEIQLERFLLFNSSTNTGVFYAAVPYFNFFNSSGNELYVITKGEGSGLVNSWAIEKHTP